MELFSKEFVERVRQLFDDHTPGVGVVLLATIPIYRPNHKQHWLLQSIRRRKDCKLYEASITEVWSLRFSVIFAGQWIESRSIGRRNSDVHFAKNLNAHTCTHWFADVIFDFCQFSNFPRNLCHAVTITSVLLCGSFEVSLRTMTISVCKVWKVDIKVSQSFCAAYAQDL